MAKVETNRIVIKEEEEESVISWASTAMNAVARQLEKLI